MSLATYWNNHCQSAVCYHQACKTHLPVEKGLLLQAAILYKCTQSKSYCTKWGSLLSTHTYNYTVRLHSHHSFIKSAHLLWWWYCNQATGQASDLTNGWPDHAAAGSWPVPAGFRQVFPGIGPTDQWAALGPAPSSRPQISHASLMFTKTMAQSFLCQIANYFSWNPYW